MTTTSVTILIRNQEIVAGAFEALPDRAGNIRYWADTNFPKLIDSDIIVTDTITGVSTRRQMEERSAMFWSAGGARLWLEQRALIDA